MILLALALGTSSVIAQEAEAPAKAKAGQTAEEVTRVVTGLVLDDATGQPIAGAQIQCIGAPHSAMTAEDGTFRIKVPVDAQGRVLNELQVSSPTSKAVRVAIRNREKLTVRLMDETYGTLSANKVYTPFGMQEQSHIASAVGVFAEDNSLSVKGSPEAAIAGKVAGLQTSFRDGNDWSGANLFLRGFNSLYGNNAPLIILDGLVIENQQFGTSMIEGQISTPFGCIDIKDIEQIVVLKDATAVYGAKGANGAILIRTKHTEDQATHISVTALGGLNMQPKAMPMLGATDSKRLLTEIAQSGNLTANQLNAMPWINANKPQLQPDGSYLFGQYYKYNQDTDWQDEIFQKGFKQQYSLNVTGGDDVAIYGVSFGFQQKEGLIKGTDFQRFNARVNADIKFTSKIRLNSNMNFVYGTKNLANQGGKSYLNPLASALVKAPFTTAYSLDEKGIASTAFEDVDALGASNPAALVSDVVAENSFYRFMGSYNLEIDLPYNLQLVENFGLDFNKEREAIFHPTIGVPYKSLPQAEVKNEQIHRVERLFNVLSETSLKYKKQVGESNYDATAGFRYFHVTAEDDWGKGYNSASNAYQTIGAGDATLHQNGGAIGNWNWLALFANLNYEWRGRYFAQATFSADASSRYGDDVALFQPFYGVNAGWLVSNEEWMQSHDWLSMLKVRVGYNMTGNDDITNYSNRQYYLSNSYLTSNGLYLGSIKNDDLKPERVQKFNVGIEAAMLDNRLNVTVDAYKSKTSDMLLYANAASFTGFSTYVANGGEMENKGIEVTMNGRIVNRKHFSWDLGLQLAHNHNEVTKLSTGSLSTVIGDGQALTQVGSPMGIFYGFRTEGVYATTAEAKAAGKSTMVGAIAEGFEAGDVRFIDQDNNGLIDDGDRVQIGNPTPDFFGGFSSTMRSHGFTLSADFTFSIGNDIYNYTRSQLESMSTYANQTKSTLTRWRSEGDKTTMPKAVFGDKHQNNRFSDRWIEDGSFLKLKNVTLSYDIPMKSTVITGLTVYGTCENVFCATRYSGYDPEIASTSSTNPLYQGVDAFTTPTTRTVYLGLKIGL